MKDGGNPAHKLLICRISLLVPIISFALLYATVRSFLAELIISYLPILALGSFFYTFLAGFICKKHFRKIRLLLIANMLLVVTVVMIIGNFYSLDNSLNISLQKQENTLTILSYNINAQNTNYEEVTNLINETQPDVISFYEFQDHQYDALINVLGQYPYSNYTKSQKPKFATIFSKSPLEHITAHHGYDTAILTYKNNDNIKFYFVHPTVPLTPQLFNDRNTILKALKEDILSDNDENILVSGDFNLSPWSYYYSSLVKNLQLTNISTQRLRFTWHAYNLFFIPLHIDHTFISQNLLNNGFIYENLSESGSDHKPQLIKIKL